LSAEQIGDAVAALFAASGVPVELRQLPAGTETVEGILGVVDETNPELVIIGLRRRTEVGKLILGSTSRRIMMGVDCPVLAVKAASG
jgi:nucleotide-binding universal stress UspA family protein